MASDNENSIAKMEHDNIYHAKKVTTFVLDPNGNLIRQSGDASGNTNANLQLGNTILFAPISCSSSGNNTLVAADATKRIKVLSYVFVVADEVSVKFRSANTDLSGAMPMVANSGVASPVSSPSQGALLQTAVNEALNLNLSSAVQVSGHLTYFLE